VTVDNGASLNTVRPEVLEAMVGCQVRVMTVSIDGATQESCEKYRVRGKLDALLGAVVRINAQKRLMQSQAPHLRWQFVVFGHNEHEIGTARAMAESLGMEFVPKLSWSGSFSPVQDEAAVRRAMPRGAANREEFRERVGPNYVGGSATSCGTARR
jgi:hypothetical protein